MTSKRCGRCRRVRRAINFNRDRGRPDGLHAWCRECQAEYRSAYYEANKKRELEGMAAYYRAHAEELRAKRIERRKSDPDKYREIEKKDRERNREKRRLRRLTPEFRAKQRTYLRRKRAEFPGKFKEKCRREQAVRWFAAKANPLDYDRIYRRDKGICYLCLLPVDQDSVHFDHRVPLSKSGTHTYRNVRVAHAGCNLRKHDKILSRGAFVAQRKSPRK